MAQPKKAAPVDPVKERLLALRSAQAALTAVRDGTISRRRFRRQMQPIRERVDALLLRGYSACSSRHGILLALFPSHRIMCSGVPSI